MKEVETGLVCMYSVQHVQIRTRFCQSELVFP